jgi:hypothetical protein
MERVRSILASPNKISQRLRMIIIYLEASLISTISEMTRAMESKGESIHISTPYHVYILSIKMKPFFFFLSKFGPYVSFSWLDPRQGWRQVVGGPSDRARLSRMSVCVCSTQHNYTSSSRAGAGAGGVPVIPLRRHRHAKPKPGSQPPTRADLLLPFHQSPPTRRRCVRYVRPRQNQCTDLLPCRRARTAHTWHARAAFLPTAAAPLVCSRPGPSAAAMCTINASRPAATAAARRIHLHPWAGGASPCAVLASPSASHRRREAGKTS